MKKKAIIYNQLNKQKFKVEVEEYSDDVIGKGYYVYTEDDFKFFLSTIDAKNRLTIEEENNNN